MLHGKRSNKSKWAGKARNSRYFRKTNKGKKSNGPKPLDLKEMRRLVTELDLISPGNFNAADKVAFERIKSIVNGRSIGRLTEADLYRLEKISGRVSGRKKKRKVG